MPLIRPAVNSAISVFASVILVGTLVSPVAAEEFPNEPVVVPPLVSAPVVHPGSTTPRGDFTNLSPVPVPSPAPAGAPNRVAAPAPPGAQGTLLDEGSATLASQTEYTHVFENADGTKTTRLQL